MSYKRAAPLAEKNTTTGLSDFSVRDAAWQHSSGVALSQEVPRVK
jgi:hypothetical protein